MNITLAVDEKLAERARNAAQAMGKSLNQAERDYLEQLAGRADGVRSYILQNDRGESGRPAGGSRH